MLITENFIVLNLPKTGSTFVRKVIKAIYLKRVNKTLLSRFFGKYTLFNPGFKELLMPHPNFPRFKDQHGFFYQIPEKYKHKPIVSVIRNTYEHFESEYHFKWWVTNPILDKQILETHLPGFPHLSIDEYVIMRQLLTKELKTKYGIPQDFEIGEQSIKFIRMYFKDPLMVFSKLSIPYVQSQEFIANMADVEFLKQENLNHELATYLKKYNFSENELEFVRNHGKVNVSNKTDKADKTILTQDTIDYIDNCEWILIKILKSKGIVYEIPKALNN